MTFTKKQARLPEMQRALWSRQESTPTSLTLIQSSNRESTVNGMEIINMEEKSCGMGDKKT